MYINLFSFFNVLSISKLGESTQPTQQKICFLIAACPYSPIFMMWQFPICNLFKHFYIQTFFFFFLVLFCFVRRLYTNLRVPKIISFTQHICEYTIYQLLRVHFHIYHAQDFKQHCFNLYSYTKRNTEHFYNNFSTNLNQW